MKRFWKLWIVVFSALTCLALGLSAAACASTDEGVEYNVEVYLQNISGTGYNRSDEFSSVAKGEDGARVEAPQIEHFTEVAHANATPEEDRVIGKGGDNVFTFYYDRDVYSVNYDANEPYGTASGSLAAQELPYESSFRAAANPFTLAGYRFAGWSTAAGGDLEYLPDERVTVTGPLTLYAVWDRGFTDRSGSSDLIFFPRSKDGDETVAILLRGKHEFTGVRSGNTFTFDREAGTITGAVFGNTFSYAREDIAGTYYLYDCMKHPDFFGGKPFDDASRTDSSVSLTVDSHLNATYRKAGTTETGSIAYSERGDYVFTGEKGSSFYFSFLNEEIAEGEAGRFSICGDEASAYVEAMMIGSSIYLTGGSLVLDGYGRAVLYMATGGFNLGYDGYYTVTNSITQRGQTMYRVSAVIEDLIGGLGGAEGELHENILYTMPSLVTNEMGTADGYVTADVYFGEYRGTGTMEGATLTLDGTGIFDDSAVYTTKDGAVIKGTYSYTSDRKTGLVVTITSSGGTTVLQADPYARTFGAYDASKAETYIELYRATGQLDYPMIYLYPETLAGEGHKAEIWVTKDEGTTLTLGGTGYYTTEPVGGIVFYTLHCTQREEGVSESDVPSSLVFFLSSVYSSEDNRPRSVYCLREYNGEKRYTEYKEKNGVTVQASMECELQGVGSLLLRGGVYTEGSVSYTSGGWFGTDVLTFIYAGTDGSAVQLRYTVTDTAEGKAITPAAGVETEVYYYLFLEEDQMGIYVQDLVLDGTAGGEEGGTPGRARFNDDYGDGEWQDGTYRCVGSTSYGDNIYELTVGGEVRFRFVLFGIGNETVYFRYNEALEGSFGTADGSRLDLDGFYYGAYWVGEDAYLGTFSYNPVEELIYFTANTGEEYYFRLDGTSCTVLDGAFGYFQLIDGNYESINNAEIFFDGVGHVTVTFAGGGQARTGDYHAYLPESDEYIVNCNFGTGMEMPEGGWHVRLFFGTYAQGCIVFDKTMTGTFVNDNWDVLYLDGFGTGSLYSADGTFGGEGDYTVMDEELGLMYFTLGTDTDVSIVYDSKNQTFRILDFSDISYLYLSDDLDYIAFTSNGVLRVGNRSGMYFYTDDFYYGFLYDYETENYAFEKMPIPGASTYRYNEKDYKLCEGGDRLSLDGTVEFYGEDGKLISTNGTMAAGLEVSLLTGANYNMTAKITLEEVTYNFVLNLYTGGEHSPRLTYDGVDYGVTFTLDKTNKFTVRAGLYTVVMSDYYAGYRNADGEGHHGAEIVKKVIGFGPIVHGEPTYSGTIYYHDSSLTSEPLTFEDVAGSETKKVGYRVGGLGDCIEIVFTGGMPEQTYAIDFYETHAEERGTVFVLQGFYTYEEMDTDGYKVGVKTLIAATTPNTAGNGGWGITDTAAIGKPYSVTLWRSGESAPVVCYDTGISLDGDAVWLCELADVIVAEDGSELPKPGKGYYIELPTDGEGHVTGVTVGEYEIGQAVTGGYLVNFFTDGNAVKQVVGVAYSDGSGYYWMDKTHGLEYHEETDTWTFYGTPGENATEMMYTLTFVKSETGGYDVLVTHT